jgi:hypothetical protein
MSNVEPQNVEGWFRFAQSFYKIDSSTQELTTGRIHSFDTCPPQEDSTFDIRFFINSARKIGAAAPTPLL